MKSKLFFLVLLAFIRLSIDAQNVYYVTPNGAGNNSGTSWSNAINNLQPAIDSAFNNGGGQVWVAAGTYYPGTTQTSHYTMKNNVEIYGGFSGTETALTQRNWQNNVTILSGDIGVLGSQYDNIDEIIINDYTPNNPLDTTAILDGFSITGSHANYKYQSALYNYYASPKVLNCIFSSNSGSQGGAIYAENSTISLTKCSFEHNSASQGGVIYAENSTISLTNCSFEHNSASHGGAIFAYNSDISVINCVVDDNFASSGGAIHSSNSEFVIQNSRFIGNTASYQGGAFCSGNTSSVNRIINCLVANNSAGHSGGAFWFNGTSPIITNTTIAYNDAGYGGAVYCAENAAPIFTNCILYGNTSDYNAQVYIGQSSSTPKFYYCLNQCDCIDLAPGVNYNWANYQYTIDANPQFANYTLKNYRLTLNSPCINAGTADTTGLDLPPNDLDGNSRVYNGRIDMGCYEFGNPLGILDYSSNKAASIFPNPSSDKISIATENGIKIDRIEVLSINGKVLKVYKYSGDEINIESLYDGVYLIKIISVNEEYFIKKLIKV